MFGLGLPEIIIVLVVVSVLFFGGRKVTGLANALGRFKGEFRKGEKEMEKELKKVEKEISETKETLKKP